MTGFGFTPGKPEELIAAMENFVVVTAGTGEDGASGQGKDGAGV